MMPDAPSLSNRTSAALFLQDDGHCPIRHQPCNTRPMLIVAADAGVHRARRASNASDVFR